TAIPVRRRRSKLPISKETIEAPYAILKRKAEPTIGGVLAILEELDTIILSDKAYAMGFLKY
ncbi:hypothetical protein H8356DRAFT_944276, partial [Neocallimastix lanati (nom. inval.)]